MFDIGFFELLIIGIIALIVLGPERLPKTARTVGLWVAKAKQGFSAIKNEIDRELEVQELQKTIEAQKNALEHQINDNPLQKELTEVQSDLEQAANNLQNSSTNAPTKQQSNTPND